MSKHNINVDVILQSIGREATKDITFTIHKSYLGRGGHPQRAQGGAALDHIEVEEGIGKASIVGAGLMSNCGVAAKMFEALYEGGADIEIESTPRKIRAPVLLDEEDVDRAVKAIHAKFFDEA